MIGRRVDVGLRHTPSPFVVLVDLTIALSFILIVFALSSTLQSSQSLQQLDRLERQGRIRKQILTQISSLFPGSKVGPYDANQRRQRITFMDGTRLGELFENGSYQRISLYLTQFKNRSPEMVPKGSQVFEKIGTVIRNNWTDLEYFNIHGICDTTEAPSATDRDSLSRARADNVLKLLQGQAVVGSDALDLRPGVVPLKFVVPYGTGSRLYADFPQNSRVDFVLFYTDSSEHKNP